MTGDEAFQVVATAVLLWVCAWGCMYAHARRRWPVYDERVARWRAPSCAGRPWQTKRHG